MTSEATEPSLYERLGGIYSIATVVDDLIDRVMNDPRLNANPAVNEAHHKVRRLASSISLPRWSAGLKAARRNIPGARCVSLTSS
jgi:hypothetical protein